MPPDAHSHQCARAPRPRRYNFVDESNLPCYVAALASAVGKLLSKLFSQLYQGRGAEDAADAFSKNSKVAYFAHLTSVVAAVGGGATAAVRVEAEHRPWERFFSQQGPYEQGGNAALAAHTHHVATLLLELIKASPPPVVAKEEAADVLVERLKKLVLEAREPAREHDEL